MGPSITTIFYDKHICTYNISVSGIYDDGSASLKIQNLSVSEFYNELKHELDIVDKIGIITTFFPYGNSDLRKLGSGKALLNKMLEEDIKALCVKTFKYEMKSFLKKNKFKPLDGMFTSWYRLLL